MLKRKIIAIRPFHMANFSSGALYALCLVPFAFLWTTLFVVLGVTTVSRTKKDFGALRYSDVKSHLNSSILLLCLVVFLLLFALLFGEGLNLVNWAAIFLVISTVSLGPYAALSLSAWHLSKRGNLTKGRWILWAWVYGMLLLVIHTWLLIILVSYTTPIHGTTSTSIVAISFVALASIAVAVSALTLLCAFSISKRVLKEPVNQEKIELEQNPNIKRKTKTEIAAEQNPSINQDEIPRQNTEDSREFFSDVESRES